MAKPDKDKRAAGGNAPSVEPDAPAAAASEQLDATAPTDPAPTAAAPELPPPPVEPEPPPRERRRDRRRIEGLAKGIASEFESFTSDELKVLHRELREAIRLLELHGLARGDKPLDHVPRGRHITCLVRGPGAVKYGGKIYPQGSTGEFHEDVVKVTPELELLQD